MKNLAATLAATLALCALVAAPATAGTASESHTNLPLYPGAAATTAMKPLTSCGHTITAWAYKVDSGKLGSAVAWFKHAMPGVTPLAHNEPDPSVYVRMETFYAPGGAASVTVGQTTFTSPGSMAAVKDFTDKESAVVDVTYMSYSPPLSGDELRGKCHGGG